MLIETDAPDMVPMTGRREMEDVGRKTEIRGRKAEDRDSIPWELNHPANLVLVVRAVAELRGVPLEEIAALTAENAARIYRIAAM